MKQSLLAHLLPVSEQRVARQSLWLSAIMVVQLLTGVVQLSLCARILGPEGLGVLFTIMATTSLLFALLAVPGNEVITTYVTRSQANGKQQEATQILRYTLIIALGTRLLGYAVIVMVAPVISHLLTGDLTGGGGYREMFNIVPKADSGLVALKGDYVIPTLVYAVTGIMTGVSGEAMAVLRLADRVHLGFIAMLIGSLAKVVALATVFMIGEGLLAVTLAFIIGTGILNGVLLVAMFVSARKMGLSVWSCSWSFTIPPEIIRFQIAHFGRSVVEALNRYIDVLVIVGLTNATQVGFYRAAHQIVDISRCAFGAIARGIQNEYSKLWFSSNRTMVKRLSLRFTVLATALGLLGYGLLIMLHESIIRILLGADFTDIASPLLIMIPGGLVFACITALYVLPSATGRAMPHFVATLVALVVQLIALIVLTPTYGAMGAALAYTIYFLVFAGVMMPFVLTTLRSRKNWKDA